ncbi:hypothetical protein CVT26_002116 [Gymnopilus dilepis]|uniref:Pentacotripeptide-repeat region of PRORP domain-containing protein n=1 Tax=Gymnopilus dilepis TaxID=231916 RepID=A0A409VBP5_9AGAR|nr:hypothetical protein CVT26_002116 [Gymnopilus dilepis]
MLQRSFFVQKRRLELSICVSKHIACRPLSGSGRRPSPQHARAAGLPSTAAGVPSDLSKGVSKYLTSPRIGHPEFERVIRALASDLGEEKILQFIKRSPSLSSVFSDRKRLREQVKDLARSTTPHFALQLLNIAAKLGCTLNASAYESVSFHLAQSSHWDIILAVVASAANHIGHTTLRLLNWRALALLESQHFSRLERILEEFQAAGISPTRRTYHIILSGHMRNYNMEGAKTCLQDMQSAGFRMDATTHSLIGNLYRRFGADPKVCQNVLDSLSELHCGARTTVVNRLMQSFLDCDDIPSTARLLMLFDPDGVSRIIAILTRYRSKGANLSTPLTLPDLSASPLPPDANTCAVFMNYLIRKSAFDDAIALGKDMISTGMTASSNLVASFMHAYFLCEQGNVAIRIVSKLSVPSAVTAFQNLAVGFSGGEPPSLDLSRVSLTPRICNVLLRGILNRQGLNFVPTVFSIMHSNNVRPNTRTLEILLSFMNKTNVARPRTLFQILRKLSSKLGLSLTHIHHIAARIFRDEKYMFIPGAWTPRLRGRRRRKRMRLLQVGDPFDPTGGIAFDRHLSYHALAKPLLSSLKAKGVMSDSVMVFLRIRRHSVLHKDVESAHRVLRTLMARGMHPNAYHFGALVEGYSLSGNFDGADEVMRTAEASGVKPNAAMYTSIIAAYARHRDAKLAFQTFKKMIAVGIAPDIASIDALVSAFYTSGAHETAHTLLIKLWGYIQPFPRALETADLSTLLSHFRALRPRVPPRVKSTKERRKALYSQLKAVLKAYEQFFVSSSRLRKQ